MTLETLRSAAREAFRSALDGFRANEPVLVLGHNDADGLSASAILARAFDLRSRTVRVRIVGRGENPWSEAMRAELADAPVGFLVVADLGVREGALRADTPTVLIDHHVPAGAPEGATVISGFGADPVPTSSLIAYWCAQELADVDHLLWLTAIGIVGDMGEKSGFPEMDEARRRYGATALRRATSLLNAPRRTASGNSEPALSLLMTANGPKEVLSGEHPETALLRQAREEVKRELDAAVRVAPKVGNGVALIRFHSPCQIHPLVAQAWRNRLKNNVVIAANIGYRPGSVHFAARTALDLDLVAFLRRHAPPGADENYGGGHVRATGGALRPASWNAFVASLGFGPDLGVDA